VIDHGLGAHASFRVFASEVGEIGGRNKLELRGSMAPGPDSSLCSHLLGKYLGQKNIYSYESATLGSTGPFYCNAYLHSTGRWAVTLMGVMGYHRMTQKHFICRLLYGTSCRRSAELCKVAAAFWATDINNAFQHRLYRNKPRRHRILCNC